MDEIPIPCTCPCCQRRPSLPEVVAGYVMLFGVATLLIWIAHTLYCTSLL